MVPPVITEKLGQLRRRERLQGFAWGLARVLTVALIVLLLACAVDWIIDRWTEVSDAVRITILAVQILLAAGLLAWLVLPSVFRPLPDDTMALWVEGKNPALGHRLISAVQLNRPDADKEGMSPELIQLLTREAETQVQQVDLKRVVDNRRWAWCLAVLGPALLLFALPFFIWPELFSILLARQFLADRDIPRTVYLETASREVWPRGEVLRLEIKATGPGVAEDPEGELIIHWEGSELNSTSLPLRRVGSAGPEGALYTVEVPAHSTNFTYTAWLGDGRLHRPGKVRYEARPEVRETAYVQMPESCGLTSQGKRYELLAGPGEIETIKGSWVRARIEVQKKVKWGRVHLYSPSPEKKGEEVSRGSWEIKLDKTGEAGEVEFPLFPPVKGKDGKEPEPYSRYAIEVADEYGFVNQPRPSRNLRIIDEPEPEVRLLPEQFLPAKGSFDTKYAYLYVHAGMPALEGDKVRVGYQCTGPYGLGRAVLQYRKVVLPKVDLKSLDDKDRLPGGKEPDEGGSADLPQEKWRDLDLKEESRFALDPRTKRMEDRGPFLVDQGVFAGTSFTESVGFHAIPAEDPTRLGRFVGGGRYDLQLKGLLTAAGETLVLKKGDQLEYRVVIYADRAGGKGRPWKESLSRVTTIEDFQGFRGWMEATQLERGRIQELERTQRELFEKGK